MACRTFLIPLLCLSGYLGASFSEKEALADLYFDAHLPDEAKTLYRSLADENANHSHADTWKLKEALCLFAEKRYDELLTLLESEVIADPWHAYLKGISLAKTGRRSEARHALQGCGTLTGEMRFQLAGICRDLGDLAAASAHYKALLGLPELAPLARINLAKIACESALWQEADGWLATPMEGDLHYVRAYLQGRIAYETGRFRDAIAHFRAALPPKKALSVAPSAMIYECLGAACLKEGALSRDGTFFDQARDAYRHLIDLVPTERSERLLAAAAESYFALYSYNDYLDGGREAAKHLEALPKHFPDSPLAISAHYLTGLNYKHGKRAPDGKWIKKQDLHLAIEAFHQAESAFVALDETGRLGAERDYYTSVYHFATLERALANLTIAEESIGAKRQIFLEYAEEVFKGLANGVTDQEIVEESLYRLAIVHVRAGRPEAAEEVFNKQEALYQKAGITRGYFLSRMWYERALIAYERGDHPHALACIRNADSAAKGNVLSIDELLDLWIQEALCYRALHDYNSAILILTRVTNQDVISGLRLKAMYLRADIYHRQERPELARNQLKALAKKGGEWGIKAKQTLDELYGF